MKYALCILFALACFGTAQSFDCPKGPENYLGEVLALRHQKKR
jgi:hypothetical protein